MLKQLTLLLFFFLCGISACNRDDEADKLLRLTKIFVGNTEIDLSSGIAEGLPTDRSITLIFSARLRQSQSPDAIQLKIDQHTVNADISISSDGRTVSLFPGGTLMVNTVYTVVVNETLRGANGEHGEPRQVGFKTKMADLIATEIKVGDQNVTALNRAADIPLDLSLSMQFSSPVDPASLKETLEFTGPNASGLSMAFSDENRKVLITTTAPLRHLSRYQLSVSNSLTGAAGEPFAGLSRLLYTQADETPKFPVVSDDELLTIVQRQTFKYFRDLAHPSSGMARERNTSGDIVTSGGSGFGIMALIVGMERNFITRAEGLEQMGRILSFLENADRFHGAWPHWMNGNTGDVVPFSPNDNGGDLVETSFLVQGLLTFRQYLDAGVSGEQSMIDRINALWHAVEWDWYTRGDQKVLYWHWSPDKQWAMNHPVQGYNEALITYFLAAASPSHTIDASVYHEGWARNGSIRNGRSFYDIPLPLGFDYGGPLFFAHYSFLGLDPRNLSDTYANYWTQNENHSKINHAYCRDNPKKYVGYSDVCWGLTASDNHQGYSAHSPTNDLGVITPTAALSSFPYTPEESMKALKFFYYTFGDRLWGPYGFYDAFNITEGWTAESYLAIDQGPIIVMIENHRTGLLWDLFMSAPEVQTGMSKLGFTR